MRLIVPILICVFAIENICFAWSEGGHHLIGVLAFDRLTETQQRELIEVLRSHPRFAEDFKFPEKASDEIHWLIGRACYWPDVARNQPQYNRPDWHWQLGSTLVIGNPPNVPKNPGPCPDDATLDTKDLHISQAIELCRRIWKDKSRPATERALALCWLGHLVGDAHQPCHAGSLYSEKLFPDGDRGANSIPTKQGRNLHSLWDGLLGPRWDEGDIRRRSIEIKKDAEANAWELLLERGLNRRMHPLDPLTWLAESCERSRKSVYTVEVLEPINTAESSGSKSELIDISEAYLKEAGRVAHLRAWDASVRLAKIWQEGFGE